MKARDLQKHEKTRKMQIGGGGDDDIKTLTKLLIVRQLERINKQPLQESNLQAAAPKIARSEILKRVKEKEAKLPPLLKVHKAQLGELRSWYLQEDNDLSYSTKSKDNVAENLRQANWISVIVHLGQSADLNPSKGMWLILKQHAKRRIRYPEPGERESGIGQSDT
ncbi:hypothetical protein EK21DRAFT_92764 [Setomelanomma holmii]|uniref:Uncharacterized protein n=1 Tax=Setomelanomma holmii TaxID=210430 RepID=A0A9P4H3D2_9PLEO|nr:hypothetical protein EK21DRAFT_92764 [Setomelanomma holmii]